MAMIGCLSVPVTFVYVVVVLPEVRAVMARWQDRCVTCVGVLLNNGTSSFDESLHLVNLMCKGSCRQLQVKVTEHSVFMLARPTTCFLLPP